MPTMATDNVSAVILGMYASDFIALISAILVAVEQLRLL